MVSLEQRKKVGELFAVGFHGLEIDDNIKSLIQDYGVGAIVLFKRNVRDAVQLQTLCLELQRLAKASGHTQPLFIGIDQENGLVTRISPPVASQQPGPMTLGAAGSPEIAYEVAKGTGEMLRYFGINMNYAPIGDINSEPLNPVIGVRSPGDEAAKVSEFALACARGLREMKIAPCIKHFPGHGDTAVDSHFGLPVISKSRADFEKMELVPFRDAATNGIEMVMTAHISLPELGGSKLPATLSPEALSILRNDIGYEGVIMTDCLEMDGIRATYGTVEGSLMAFQAGVDNVMICHTYDVQTAAIDRVCQAMESGEIATARVDASLARLAKLKSLFTDWETALQTQPPDSLVSINERGAKLAKQVYADAITVVRARPGLLPLSKSASTVFVSPGRNIPLGGAVDSGDIPLPTRVPWVEGSFGDKLRVYNPSVVDIRFGETDLSVGEWQQIEQAEVVILATRNARESPYQRKVGFEVARRRKERANVVAIATCAPYDFLQDPEFDTYIAVYEPTVEAFGAAADIIYGTSEARGKLPVAH